MNERFSKFIELTGAEALLNRGVSVPIKSIRMPFMRRSWEIRMTMRRPTLGRQIRIAREWLKTGLTLAEIRGLDTDGQMAFMAKHGQGVSRMIALTMERRWLPTGVMAWMVRRWMKWEYQLCAVEEFVSLLGTDPFLPIISLAERMNPMKPRLSHERKGS